MNKYQHYQNSDKITLIEKETYLSDNIGHSPKSIIKDLYKSISNDKYVICPCYYTKNKDKIDDNLDGFQMIISGKEKYRESVEVAIQRELLEEIGIYIDCETLAKNICMNKKISYKNKKSRRESIYSITYSIIDLDTIKVSSISEECKHTHLSNNNKDNYRKRIVIILVGSDLEKINKIILERNRISSTDDAGELIYIQPKKELEDKLDSLEIDDNDYKIF